MRMGGHTYTFTRDNGDPTCREIHVDGIETAGGEVDITLRQYPKIITMLMEYWPDGADFTSLERIFRYPRGTKVSAIRQSIESVAGPLTGNQRL